MNPAATPSNPLREIIAAMIRRDGPMPFERFMDLALYHPQHGYYASGLARQGKRGDYYTSPTVSPVFGHLIAKQLAEMWDVLGRPQPFWVVEFGAGARPYLAEDILTHVNQVQPPFAEAIRYAAIEAASIQSGLAMHSAHSAELNNSVECVVAGIPKGEKRPRLGQLNDLPPRPFVGCVLSNEFVDSLPVARIRRVSREWQEICISAEWKEVTRPISSEELKREVASLPLSATADYTTEVHLAAARWIRQVAQRLERGFVLTIDYGLTEDAYYASERLDGTLRCFCKHTVNNQPLERIGQQDITADVNFSALARHGRTAGLEVCGLTDQTNFLLGIGEAEISRWIESDPPKARAALALLHPEGLGAAFKVLIQHKNAPGISLSGLSRRVERRR